MSDTSIHRYALAIGSNRALSARRTPARLIDEATALIGKHMRVLGRAPVISTPPIGPSTRIFSNSAMLVETPLPPPALLALLQDIERRLGRRRHRRWGARSMDIDIILWSGGCWNSRMLTIPHPAYRQRDFVLRPLSTIVPAWRDPHTTLAVRQIQAHLKKPRKRLTRTDAPIR